MKVNKIILIIISIIIVALFHSLAIIESHTDYIPGIVTTDGRVIRETTTKYYSPEIFGIEVQRGNIGLAYLIFIQSVPGIILQIFIIYTLLKIFISKMKYKLGKRIKL